MIQLSGAAHGCAARQRAGGKILARNKGFISVAAAKFPPKSTHLSQLLSVIGKALSENRLENPIETLSHAPYLDLVFLF